MHLKPGFGVVDLKGFEQLNDLKKFTRNFPSDLNALDQILSWFDQHRVPSIPKKVWLQCQLALAEAYTNAVRYAHKGLPTNSPITIEVTLLSQYLEIRIWDQGPPFDLEQRLQSPPPLVDTQAGGGRGLLILQKISDKLSYTRTDDDRNCLLVVKYYGSSS